MSKRRAARRLRREALLAADAVRRLRSPAVLHLGVSVLRAACPSRRRRADLYDALRGRPTFGEPVLSPPAHPNCRSTLVPSGTLDAGQAESFMQVLLGESKLLEHVRVVPMAGHPRTPPPSWDGTDNHRGRSTRGLLERLRG